MVPGEIIAQDREIELNKNREVRIIEVSNIGDRPIQVGSHFHFFETNRQLSFDRENSYGMRLDIPSGTSVRFEPGETKTVNLVSLGGKRTVFGLNNLTHDVTNQDTIKASMNKAKEQGFLK